MKSFTKHTGYILFLIIVIGTITSLSTEANSQQRQESSSSLYLKEQIIRKDTIWSGKIVIEGVVVIGRAATLTIKPGSSILFKRIDRDQDGTGDSELRVLGGIIAKGTADEPITFSSAETNKSPRDWSYLLIYTSGQINQIDFCEFRHGFSGLQVQFSTASVRNSLFTNNNEGIRFGRADLALENNLFIGNNIGIRFTRMEGPVIIQNNEISNNKTGIFLVPSGQNIMDFFEPDRSGRPWNNGRLNISGNNIFNNYGYNLSLGEKQQWNLDMTGNYWGSSSSQHIEEKIFAHNRDNSLGKVIYKPFATKKISSAGINGNR